MSDEEQSGEATKTGSPDPTAQASEESASSAPAERSAAASAAESAAESAERAESETESPEESAKPAESEPVKSESAEPEPVKSESAESESVKSESVEPESVESKEFAEPKPEPEKASVESARPKSLRLVIGQVVSDRMQKTVTVLVERKVKHPLYKKYIRRSTKMHAHDENDSCRIGDRVSIVQCRPISKTKSWRVHEIIRRSK